MGTINFIGQAEAVGRIRAIAGLYAKNGLAVEHLLLVGTAGSGKSALAMMCAAEWGVQIQSVEASNLRVRGDLSAVLTNLQGGQTLLIENIGSLNPTLASVLVVALSKNTLTISIGQGPAAREHCLELKPFTLIATAPAESECPAVLRPLLTRIRLSPYTREEATEIAARIAQKVGLHLTPDARSLVGQAGESLPGKIERLLLKLARLGEDSPDESRIRLLFEQLGLPTDPANANVAERGATLGAALDFEKLIASLLRRMGFRAETTRCGSDGGIDIVAVLETPIIGGKFLIQCKRYTVGQIGAPAVRDFYGALSADRQANKGIIIATSGFTPQAREFAASVGVELVDGELLAHLLMNCGLQAPSAASSISVGSTAP